MTPLLVTEKSSWLTTSLLPGPIAISILPGTSVLTHSVPVIDSSSPAAHIRNGIWQNRNVRTLGWKRQQRHLIYHNSQSSSSMPGKSNFATIFDNLVLPTAFLAVFYLMHCSPMGSSPGGGFRPQLWVVSLCLYSFRSVPTASLHHRCYLLFCIYALRKILPCWHHEKHQWVKPVIQAAKPSGLYAGKVGHGFRQDFLSRLTGQRSLECISIFQGGCQILFFPLSVAKQNKKTRWQTKKSGGWRYTSPERCCQR